MHSMLLITWWKYHVTKHVTKSCDKISVRRSLIGSKSSWIIGSYVDIIAVQEVRVLGGHLRFRQSDSIEQIRNYNFIKLLWVGCPRTPKVRFPQLRIRSSYESYNMTSFWNMIIHVQDQNFKFFSNFRISTPLCRHYKLINSVWVTSSGVSAPLEWNKWWFSNFGFRFLQFFGEYLNKEMS